jgi:hypothetical protein
MLKLLRAAALNHGGHRLERAVLRLRQPTQISTGHSRVVASARAEEMPMPIQKRRESLADLLDQRYG